MRFLLDAHWTNELADYLRAGGHDVYRVQDRSLPSTPDPLIVADANQLRAIIITRNRKHFRPLVLRDDPHGLVTYPDVGLITCRFPLTEAVRLFERFLPLIEFEHQQRQVQNDKRIIVELDFHNIRFW
jgi:predicted nuclease of predicted toxin-antitoxin system